MSDAPPIAPTIVPRESALPVRTLDAVGAAASTRSLSRARWMTIASALFLVVLAGVFFWKIIILRQVLVPFDVLYAHDPLWQPLAPAGFRVAANPLDSDALTEFYPWTVFAANALHRGVLPLWNPDAFAGTPFLASMQTAVLYPINLILFRVAAPIDILGLRALIHLALTLLGTFLFARALRLTRAAALLSAIAFGMGLPYVVWLEHPMSAAIAWLPWLLLCLERVVQSRQYLRWLPIIAAVIALEFLAGHGESTTHALLLCGAYTLFRLLRGRSDRRNRFSLAGPLALLGAAVVLGAALAGAHLLPTLAQIAHSEAAADRTAAAQALPATILGIPDAWRTLVTAMIPDYFGNPTWNLTLLPPDLGYNEITLYIGTVPLLLAFLAVYLRRDACTTFFAAVALTAAGAALRLPLFVAIDSLPVLRLAANGRLRVEYALAMAVLAGYGLDALRGQQNRIRARRMAALWLPATATLALLALYGLLNARSGAHAAGVLLIGRAALPVLWATIFTALLWLPSRYRLSFVISAAAVALTVVDLCAVGLGYHTFVTRSTATMTPPAVRAVLRDRSLYRVAGLDMALLPSTSALYGLQDVRGYDPAYGATYERYFTSAFSVPGGMRLSLAPFGPSPAGARALDLMNVKYLFAACNIHLLARVYHLVYRGAGCVYRNATVMPRAVLVHRVQAATPRAALLLSQGAIDPRVTAILDPFTVRAYRGAHLDRVISADTDLARVTHYDLNRVDIETRSSLAGVLILSDAYDPDWKARIDGHSTSVARADAVFRGVAVPAGRHHVTFVYAPHAFILGVTVSALAAVVWLLLAIVATRQWMRQRPDPLRRACAADSL